MENDALSAFRCTGFDQHKCFVNVAIDHFKKHSAAAMYKVDIPLDTKESAAIERRRIIRNDKKAQLLDARNDCLQDQIAGDMVDFRAREQPPHSRRSYEQRFET